MEITDSPMYTEYKKIQTEGRTASNFFWTLRILANNKTIDAVKVVSVDIDRDYNTHYADQIVVRAVFMSGNIHYDIAPFRNDLKAILTRTPIGEISTGYNENEDITSQVMRATLSSNSYAVMEANRSYTVDREAMNRMELEELDIGLTDLVLEQLRTITVGGVYRGAKLGDLARHILTNASSQIQTDEETKIQGVDMYDPPNQDATNVAIIPTGTKLVEVPDYIHYNVGGIYNAGLGFYLQNQHWYLYPLFDTKRYENSDKGLTIFRLPPNLYHGSERTFRTTENQLIVVIGDDVKTADTTEFMQMNLGNGTRFADPTQLFNSFGATEGNKTTVKRKNNNSEYVASARPDDINNAPFAQNRITSNSFAEASRMAQRLGMYLVCTWHNSDPSTIWPGMPVRYVFMANTEVYECFGIVQSAKHAYSLHTPGSTSSKHISSSSLLLFLGKAQPWAD